MKAQLAFDAGNAYGQTTTAARRRSYDAALSDSKDKDEEDTLITALTALFAFRVVAIMHPQQRRHRQYIRQVEADIHRGHRHRETGTGGHYVLVVPVIHGLRADQRRIARRNRLLRQLPACRRNPFPRLADTTIELIPGTERQSEWQLLELTGQKDDTVGYKATTKGLYVWHFTKW